MKMPQLIAIMGLLLFLCVSRSMAGEQAVIQEKSDNSYFTPANPPPVSYQDNRLSISPIYNGEEISLRIAGRSSTPLLVTLPHLIAQLSEVRPVYRNRIAVTGLADSAVSVVAIIDQKKGNVIDTFWCYKPAISPDGRWIAFQKFFPPHFAEVIDTDFRVYDLSLDAKGNRHGTDHMSEIEVGTVVYPFSAPETGDSKSIDYIIAYKFVWWQQSDQYIFADEGKVFDLVLVKLRKIGKGWDTFIYDLNKDGAVCEIECETSRVTSFTPWNDVVEVKVFPSELGAKDLSFQVHLDQFKQISK